MIEVKQMQVKLSSGNYDIITSNNVFLFDDTEELTIKVTGKNDFDICLTIKFLTDDSSEQKIERQIMDDRLILLCYNFDSLGTGLIKPTPIAKVNGKLVWLSMWAYLEGSKEPKTRSVKYTMYCEQ